MGIPRLNRFLRSACRDHIQSIHLSRLRGKTIVIDASVYLYRFKGEGGIEAGLYQMLSLLNRFSIKAIFVFDGRAPAAKRAEIQDRAQRKTVARDELARLTQSTEGLGPLSRELRTRISTLRREAVRLTSADHGFSADLIRTLGGHVLRAKGEADGLCAEFVKSGLADACLSEDTDLFAHGCPRVLRYFSLLGQTAVLYDWEAGRSSLGVDQETFQVACALSGCDYTRQTRGGRLSWDDAWALRGRWASDGMGVQFDDWLVSAGIISISDRDNIDQAVSVYRTPECPDEEWSPQFSSPNEAEARRVLAPKGFVFVDA